MIEAIDQQIEDWARSVLSHAEISLLPPPLKQGISLYLLNLQHLPPTRSNDRSSLQVQLRYLVTCWHKNPREAHSQLGTLLFAAMSTSDYEVSFEAITESLWRSFQILPQPAFLLHLIARQERAQPEVPRVRHPLQMQGSSITALHGIVTGPQAVPITDAYVTIPALQLAQHTNAKGEFYFKTVPDEALHMLIRAKGAEQQITVKQDNGQPVRIHFDHF